MIEPLKAAVDGAPVDLRDFHRAISALIEAENARQALPSLSQEDRARILKDWRNAGLVP